jgi:hypothetical protein
MNNRRPGHRQRGCWGCMLHHPLTVLLTLLAVFWWCVEALPVGITILVGKTPDLTSLALASFAIGAAQFGPRLVAAGVSWGQRHYAERLMHEYADDAPAAIATDPPPRAD